MNRRHGDSQPIGRRIAFDAGASLPEFDWTVEGTDENVIRVNTVDAPVEVRLWQATNPD